MVKRRISDALDRFGLQILVTPEQYHLLTSNELTSRAQLPGLADTIRQFHAAAGCGDGEEEEDNPDAHGADSTLDGDRSMNAPRSHAATDPLRRQPISTEGRSTVEEPELPGSWRKRRAKTEVENLAIAHTANLWASLLFLEALFSGSKAQAGEKEVSDKERKRRLIKWKPYAPPQFSGWAPSHQDKISVSDKTARSRARVASAPRVFAFVTTGAEADSRAAAKALPLRAFGTRFRGRIIDAAAQVCASIRAGHLTGVPRFVMASDLYLVFGTPIVPVFSPARIGSASYVSPALAEATALERWTHQVNHRGRVVATFSADAERLRRKEDGTWQNDDDVAMDDALSATSRSSSCGEIRLTYGDNQFITGELAREEEAVEIDRFYEESLYFIDAWGVARYYADEDQSAGLDCNGIGVAYWTSDGKKMYAPPGHPRHPHSYGATMEEHAEMMAEAEAARLEALKPPPRRPRLPYSPDSFERRIFLGTRYTSLAEELGRRPILDVIRTAHDVKWTRACDLQDFSQSAAASAAAATVILEHDVTGVMRHCRTYTTPAHLYQALHDALLPANAGKPPRRCPEVPRAPGCFTCVVLGTLFALVAAQHNGASAPRSRSPVLTGISEAFSRHTSFFRPILSLLETQRLPGWRAKNLAFARCLSQRLLSREESLARAHSEYRWVELRIGALAGHTAEDSVAAPLPNRLDIAQTVSAINAFCKYRAARLERSVTGELCLYVISVYVDMIRGAFLLAAAIPPYRRAPAGSAGIRRRHRRATHAPSTTALAESDMAAAIRGRTVADIAWRMAARSMTTAKYLPQVDPMAMAVRWLGRMIFSDRARGSGPSGRLVARTMANVGLLKCIAAVAPTPDLLLHSLAYGLERHNHSPVYSLLHAATCEPRRSYYVTLDLLAMVSDAIRRDVGYARDPNTGDYKKFLPLANYCDQQRATAVRLFMDAGRGGSNASKPDGSTWVVLDTEKRWPLEFLAFAAASFASEAVVETIATQMRTLSIYTADSSIDPATLRSVTHGTRSRYSCLDGLNATIRLAAPPSDGPWVWRRDPATIPGCGCGHCHTIKVWDDLRSELGPYRVDGDGSVQAPQWAAYCGEVYPSKGLASQLVHVPTVLIRDLCAIIEVLHGEVPLVTYENDKFITVKCARSATRLSTEDTTVPFCDLEIVNGLRVSDIFPVWKSPLSDTETSFDAAGLSPFVGAEPLILEAALAAPLISVTTEDETAAEALRYGSCEPAQRRRIFTSSRSGHSRGSGVGTSFVRPPASA